MCSQHVAVGDRERRRFCGLKTAEAIPHHACRMTDQTELGDDVGSLICILTPGRLKHAKWLGFITCLGFVQCHSGGRSKAHPDAFIHVPLHSSQLSSEALVCPQDTAAGGMIQAPSLRAAQLQGSQPNPPPTDSSSGSRGTDTEAVHHAGISSCPDFWWSLCQEFPAQKTL